MKKILLTAIAVTAITSSIFADIKVFNNTDKAFTVKVAWDAGSGQKSNAEGTVQPHGETWIKGDLWNRKDYIRVFSGDKLVAESKPKENKNLMLGEVGLGGGGNLRVEINQDDKGTVTLHVSQAGLLGERLN